VSWDDESEVDEMITSLAFIQTPIASDRAIWHDLLVLASLAETRIPPPRMPISLIILALKTYFFEKKNIDNNADLLSR
jgi:hypothetical protein